jgi:hypothetical protein
MIEQSHEEELFQRYLLGDLAEDERERLQERYFADTNLFSRLLHVEADLIDAYQRGELTENERQRFEQRFGKLRGIDQRLRFAGLLSRTADQHAANVSGNLPGKLGQLPVEAKASGLPWLSSTGPSLSSRVVPAALLAIAAIILVAAVLVVSRGWLKDAQPGRELASSQTDSASAQPTPQLNTPATPTTTEKTAPAVTSPDEIRKPALPKAQRASVIVLLHEGVTRESGQSNQVVLSPATRSVQTQLVLPSDLQTRTYANYQALVQTVSGAEVIRRDGLKIYRSNGSASVRVSIPVELLKTTDYVVLLSGQRSDGTQQYLRGYSFSVTRK